MTSTNFEGPLRVGGADTGNTQTDRRGFVRLVKQVSLSQASPRQVITLPPNSTLLDIGAIRTSAFTGGDDLIDMRVNFGTSADVDQYGKVLLQNTALAELQVNVKQVPLSVSANVYIPPESTLTKLGAIITSALTGSDVSAAKIQFGDGTDVDQHGVVPVSAATRYNSTGNISAAQFDSGGLVVISMSAENTSVVTGGGGRAFVEYVTHDRQGTQQFKPAVSGSGSFDTETTIVVTLSANATTSFTGGGARALVGYVQGE